MSIELILGIAGIIIALSVAITTIWQGILTRQHNRLSVKPILRIDRYTILDEKVNFLLMNTGVGPAVISSVKFFVDGIVVKEKLSKPGNLALQKIGLDLARYKIFEIFPQESFSAGEQQKLFESENAINNPKTLLKIKKAFDRISVEIEYESIYEEKFKLYNRGK